MSNDKGYARRRLLTSLVSVITALSAWPVSAEMSCKRWQQALEQWEHNMVEYGHRWGRYLDPDGRHDQSERFGAFYYDAQWVFYQIGDYLEEPEPWNTYAEFAEATYRGYLGDEWIVAGWQRFVHGLYEDYARGRGTTSAEIDRLRRAAAFDSVASFSGKYNGAAERMSRELAYTLQANVFAERAGGERIVENGVVRVVRFAEWMKGHLEQWQSGQMLPGEEDQYRFSPFMAGLTMHALIDLAEWEAENERDIDALWGGDWDADLADFLIWMLDAATVRDGRGTGDPMWIAPDRFTATFLYEDRGGENEPAWDLNMLLAFPYAFIGQSRGAAGDIDTGVRLLDAADRLFAGSAYRAWLGQGKQFNQAYRLAFRYLDARARASEFYLRCDD